MTRAAGAVAVAALTVTILPAPAAQETPQPAAGANATRLVPTAHPPVPSDVEALWYAPPPGATVPPAVASFARGVQLLEEENNPAAALPLINQKALGDTALADYARFYSGRALLVLGRHEEAAAAFASVATASIPGHLPEDAALGQADALEARLDFAGAAAAYDRLLQRKLAATHLVLWRLAAVAERLQEPARAVAAYRRLYYEYPLSPEADQAEDALTRLNAWDEDEDHPQTALALKRADVLFQARRWTAARTSYERARDGAQGSEKDRVAVRLAACDVQLQKFKQAQEPLRGQLAGPYGDEAGFYLVTTLRGLGDRGGYEREARTFADGRRASPFAEEMLNNLASHFIIADEDGRADEIFRLLIERYPAGRFAERAYWRSGWWAYRDGKFKEAATLFDRGAAQFTRSDYRPSWLYWSGRAWQQAGDKTLAHERLSLTATDYFNSYYGRLARRHLGQSQPAAIASHFGRPTGQAANPFPTASRVTALIAAGLHREALEELQYAQRMWGDSPQLTATLALVHHRMGSLRLGINAMKRAYPQWMAAGGEQLPLEIQKIVFPVDYWPLLQKHASARGLDPYLIAALVAQESTFDPVIRSSANAVGLMQVLPSTGAQFARRLKLRGFTPARLTDPETNVRLGTAIFAESLRRFGGGVHYALAAYNAGDHRVTSWLQERSGMPQDVFIDDIPFPETQNYVKRILGTAEDYRRLYGASRGGR